MSTRNKVVAVVVLALGMAVASGCAKITRSHYDQIQDGMTLSQVESILGTGKEEAGVGGAIGKIAGSAKVMRWGDDQKWITVTFVNDKVVAKAEKGL